MLERFVGGGFMIYIDPLLSLLLSLFDSYRAQLSLVQALYPGNMRLMATGVLKHKIVQDKKMIDKKIFMFKKVRERK